MMTKLNHLFSVGFGVSTLVYTGLAVVSGQHAWIMGAGISMAGTAVSIKKTEFIALISGK
jgi:hypothetical protein